jgi:hypothetical protein
MRRLPAIPNKGAGGPTWRVAVPGVAGGPRPLLMLILLPEGADRAGGRIIPRARTRGAGGAV